MILKGYDVKRKNMKETDVPHDKMVIQAHKIKVAHDIYKLLNLHA